MKFKDFLNIAGETSMAVTVEAFGMFFTTTHYTDYYKERATDEMMAMRVSAVRAVDGVLKLDLRPEGVEHEENN